MLFDPVTISLKDGRSAILRPPMAADAAEMIACMRDTAGETDFLLGYPEERNIPVEKESAFLAAMADDPNAMMIMCEVDGKLAGNCHLAFNTKIKKRHRADVAIALRKAYWGLGIGSAMFDMMIHTAKTRTGVQLLELEFIEGNCRARALYEKFGFRVVALHPDAIMLKDGTLLNEYLMQKQL